MEDQTEKFPREDQKKDLWGGARIAVGFFILWMLGAFSSCAIL